MNLTMNFIDILNSKKKQKINALKLLILSIFLITILGFPINSYGDCNFGCLFSKQMADCVINKAHCDNARQKALRDACIIVCFIKTCCSNVAQNLNESKFCFQDSNCTNEKSQQQDQDECSKEIQNNNDDTAIRKCLWDKILNRCCSQQLFLK